MKLSVEIIVSSTLWRRLPRARSIAREMVGVCIEESGASPGTGAEIAICLSDDEHLRALNARWRGLDTPTNVLSFSDRTGGGRVGDIAIAYETVEREAAAAGIAAADHYRHLIAHGFLHLIGYDHQTEHEAERMEALEGRILQRVGVADPYVNGAVEE
jgi:probable rRNA maturation factor